LAAAAKPMEDNIREKISKVSHDLRNSLAIVYSHAQLLQLMLEKKNPPAGGAEYDTATELVGSIEQMQAALAQKMEELKAIHSDITDDQG
jgi:signal transduction histidine kinase